MSNLDELAKDYVEMARSYAVACHDSTNHRYNGYPYSFHLAMVYAYGKKYAHLLPKGSESYALAACWTHDLIEDTRQTFNDVKTNCGEIVAEITYALTNEKGKNRAERANSKYYEGIRRTPLAAFVKICDRLANAKYSKDSNSSMLDAYRKEYKHFEDEIYSVKFDEMFAELKFILQEF